MEAFKTANIRMTSVEHEPDQTMSSVTCGGGSCDTDLPPIMIHIFFC